MINKGRMKNTSFNRKKNKLFVIAFLRLIFLPKVIAYLKSKKHVFKLIEVIVNKAFQIMWSEYYWETEHFILLSKDLKSEVVQSKPRDDTSKKIYVIKIILSLTAAVS